MTEPLDPDTAARLARTRAAAAVPCKVDLAADVRVGTLVHRARPVESPKGATCPYCQKRFRPRHQSQKYCDGVCQAKYWRERGNERKRLARREARRHGG